jgi:uncharacterized protein (TIGR03435 family)
MTRQIVCLAVLAASAMAQKPAPVAFEVASVKPAAAPTREPAFCPVPCTPGERITVVGSRVDIRYMSLQRLIVIAYRIKPYQL